MGVLSPSVGSLRWRPGHPVAITILAGGGSDCSAAQIAECVPEQILQICRLRSPPPPQLKLDRASVRRWALAAGLAPDTIALPAANALLDAVRSYHNAHEKHRAIGSTPLAAWERARREKRCALHPFPLNAWWSSVWSQRSGMRVNPPVALLWGPTLAHRQISRHSPHSLSPPKRQSLILAPPDKPTRPILLHSPAPATVLL